MDKTRLVGKFVGMFCKHSYWTDLNPEHIDPMRICKKCHSTMQLWETKTVGDAYWSKAVKTQRLELVQL